METGRIKERSRPKKSMKTFERGRTNGFMGGVAPGEWETGGVRQKAGGMWGFTKNQLISKVVCKLGEPGAAKRE